MSFPRRRGRYRGYNDEIAHGWGAASAVADTEEPSQDERAARYNRLHDYYNGIAYENADRWEPIKSDFALYRHIRQLWDHTHALVDFYATHVWDGAIARDGRNLPNGIRNAVPFSPDINPKLAEAYGQLFSWWNFQELKDVICREVSNLGEYLIEIVDDIDRGKVELQMIWPGDVYEVVLDRPGNVVSYTIAYESEDEPDDDDNDWDPKFLYVRKVDKERTRTWELPLSFNLEQLEDPETPAPLTDEDNEFGFVPARWWRFRKIPGTVRGESVYGSSETQLDEVNSLLSHVIDKTHVNLQAPVVVAGNIATNKFEKAISKMTDFARRTQTSSLENPNDGRETLNIFQGPAGTTVSTIELRVSEATLATDRLTKAIEKKFPEVTFYEQLRDMTQITGPAASRMLGDVEHALRSASAGFDNNLVATLQMAVAIAGHRRRSKEGGWAENTKDRQKFDGFNLESFRKGDLDTNILPRPLIPMTELELLQLIDQKSKTLPFYPDQQKGEEAGYDSEQVAKWIADYEKKQEEMEQKALDQEQKRAAFTPRPQGGAPPGGSGRPPGIQDRRTRTQPTNGRQNLTRVK